MELLPILFVIFVFTVLLIFSYLSTLKLWKDLRNLPSVKDKQFSGLDIGIKIIKIGNNNLPTLMHIQVVREGVLIQPRFFSQKEFCRVLIPWDKIQSINDRILISKFVEVKILIIPVVYLYFKPNDYQEIETARVKLSSKSKSFKT